VLEVTSYPNPMPTDLPMPPYRFQPTPASSCGYAVQGPVLVTREIDDALHRALRRSTTLVAILDGDGGSGV
jgi:hypothetical protein